MVRFGRRRGNPVVRRFRVTNPFGEMYLFGQRQSGSVVTLKYLGISKRKSKRRK